MILLPVFTLLLIFFYYQKRNRYFFGIVSLLILTYVVMGLASLVLELSGLFPSVFPYAFEPMAYLSLCLIILFMGFSKFKDHRFIAIKIDNIHIFKIIENILLVGGLLAIIYFLPFARKGLTGDIGQNRIQLEYQMELLGERGIVNSIFSLIGNLFILAQMFAFINLVPREGKRNYIKAYLLLFSSLSYVVYILAYVGRDGVVYWIMSFIFCFYLFKGFLIKADLNRMKRMFWYALTVLIIPFMLISISRFKNSEYGVGWNILNYAGQQIKNFNDYYPIYAPLQYGRNEFPLFVRIVESTGIRVNPPLEKEEKVSYFLDYGVIPWTFKTFIGSIIGDFGKAGTLVFLWILSLLSRNIVKKVAKSGVFLLSNLLLFILIYQIVYWGVFYFRLYSANYYMLLVLILILLFKLGRSSRHAVYVYKLAKPTM